ncbi:riboflavin kinase [Candidatus Daviesbacteria bacterium]|nr:riboflavin kinase [Candidatus Daviesbacteria bacterium]
MYKFWGKVRTHNKRGAGLGFPTANINLIKHIPDGIYISQTKIKGKKYFSLTFIGFAKTFNEKSFHAETYIFDFKQNIYGYWISVALIKKIRSNQKFKSVDNLIKQMKKDEAIAREYFRLDSNSNFCGLKVYQF